MISGRKWSRSFVTLQINAGRHDYLGVVHILRNQPRGGGGGGFQMLTVDYGGGGGGVWSLIT